MLGLIVLEVLIAFEALAVATVTPAVAADLSGLLTAGLAPTMPVVVVAGRGVQGLGAGLLTVALYALVGSIVPVRAGHRRAGGVPP